MLPMAPIPIPMPPYMAGSMAGHYTGNAVLVNLQYCNTEIPINYILLCLCGQEAIM